MPISGELIHKIKGVGVEVGVWYGEGLQHILAQCSDVHHLYAVDPYEKAEEFQKCELWPAGFTEKGFGDAKMDAIKNTMKWSERVWFIFARSVEAASVITEPLDFVYIDANHNYEEVKKDIEAWYPKIKKGGILSGHDYTSPGSGVPRAVDEFVNKNNLKLEAKAPDWYLYKP